MIKKEENCRFGVFCVVICATKIQCFDLNFMNLRKKMVMNIWR